MSNGIPDLDDGSDLVAPDALKSIVIDGEQEGISVLIGEMADGSVKVQLEMRTELFVQIMPVELHYNKAAERMILAWKRETIEGGGVSKASGNGRCKS